MSEQESSFDEHVPISAKIAYGSASSGHALLSGIVLNAINIFYLAATNINPIVMGYSWLVFIAWNMINDPLIGILQDKTKSKLGRRIPYLRYGSIFYVLAFIWIWFPFTNEQGLLFWNHLLMLFVFDTMFSMMGLIFYSMPAEMALTAKERGNIMIFTTALGAVGTVGAILLPFMLSGDNPNIMGFRIMMIIFGILSGLVIFIASYYIKENKYTQRDETLGFWESIRETFKNKPFLIVEISIFANVIMQGVLLGYIVYLFNYVVSFTADIPNILSIILVLVVLVISVLWMMKNIEKYGLKKLMRLGALVAIIGFVILIIIGGTSNINQFNKIPFVYIALPLICIVFGLVAYLLLGQPLMADCIDNDEVLTGKRRETTYSGVNALITKPAVSIGNFLFLWIITIFGFKSPEQQNDTPIPPSGQAPSVATGVLIAFTVIPAICLAIGYISLYFYPLDGPEWNEKKRMLQQIHKRKELEYIEYLETQGIIDKKKKNSTDT